MASLTAKRKSFLAMMGKSEEHERKGFDLLLKKRDDFLEFFDPLLEAGFFEADRNPSPRPGQTEGSVQIPYWKALDYLEACARHAGQKDDAALAEKVLKIVRSVSTASANSDSRDNYHTWWQFAEVLGLLPITSVSQEDIELVGVWLSTKYDRLGVVHALDEGVLRRFLASDNTAAWQKALRVTAYCTATQWEPSRIIPDTNEPVTIADGHELKELINHHAFSLGRRVGCEAAQLFADRVREVYGQGRRASWSYLFRPAVKDDRQNRSGNIVEDLTVEGLRDALLGWCDTDVAQAKSFVKSLLFEENEMLRRIGIFVLGQRWEDLQDLYPPIIRPDLFALPHLNEVYGLLRDRFEAFSAEEKRATIEAIRNLPKPEGAEAGSLERLQLRWLSAVTGTSYSLAAQWLARLTDRYGPVPENPDYLTFVESRWGPGPSPHNVQELIARAKEGTLVDALSAFAPTDPWSGPTVEGLVDELERAVASAPDEFAVVLLDFLEAPLQYQYGLLRGFLELWGEPEETATPDWENLWGLLLDFFEQLLSESQFWDGGTAPGRVTPSWISKTIADLLHHGTREGQRAYPVFLFARCWALIQTLIERSQAVTEPSDNPMDDAINSPKGCAIQAAFGHILRACRIADEQTGSHAEVWSEFRGFFDRELALCTDRNFEFSTFCGAFLSNLEYMEAAWLRENALRIFPNDYPKSLGCALGGLAYASINSSTYRVLRDGGVLDLALPFDMKGRHTRIGFMERLALGYLWSMEPLDSPRFSFLFESDDPGDLELISQFFCGIPRENLTPQQAGLVEDYWRRCIGWAEQQMAPPADLLSSLSGLATFLTTAERRLDLLLAVVPFVHIHYNAYEFMRELNRLAENSPAEVCKVLEVFLDTHGSYYDYENRMQSLVRKLAKGEFRTKAISFCQKLHSVPGMEALYNELIETA